MPPSPSRAPASPPAPSPHEPRLARVAAIVADPARSRMLAYLLSGDYASAGELARAASVTPATASGHLAKMLEAQFIACEQRGRHRYYRLADADVAHALESLALVAERGTHEEAWSRPERERLRQARCCYGHLAGALGVRLFGSLLQREGLSPSPEGFDVSEAGRAWLAELGYTPSAPTRKRRYAYRCLDWSERRDHLAGQLADELLQHFLERGWLRRGTGRAVELTPTGVQELLPRLEDSALTMP
ncbi:ArsR family transcriptional regulator [Hylemonella gracilis str. Niagara R]|uniref:ArsR family transcriptional regulator n=1 Tax=Hylemonella gracilis str. Niagara R TaxID=1458275 RepID=A0A016XK95_9BURK|nr:metalloregulator ArsR/SmtB family transcription factor [Hylemonella gracilis]EYC52276.1 ArsR family transcriptional regulator [Hylemonella gracilis str. Niagara R]